MEEAAKKGFSGAETLWQLTPREITARMLEAKRKLSLSDLMAWMNARYIALSLHAPEKLPEEPVFFREDTEEKKAMSGEEMKARFTGYAKRERGENCDA